MTSASNYLLERVRWFKFLEIEQRSVYISLERPELNLKLWGNSALDPNFAAVYYLHKGA